MIHSCLFSVGISENMTTQGRLLHHLFQTYDKRVRPVYIHQDITHMELTIELVQVLQLVRMQLPITKIACDKHSIG